jgi:hypothetical protein
LIKKEVLEAAHEFAMQPLSETQRATFESLSSPAAAQELFPQAIAAFNGFVQGVKWAVLNLEHKEKVE